LLCPRCGRGAPPGSVVCAYCGCRLPSTAASPSRMTCARCGKFMPLRGKLEKRVMCPECESRYNQEVVSERDREERRKALDVSQIIVRNPELREKIMARLGLKQFNGRFYVDYVSYQDICYWDKCVSYAKNLETAKRYEDAAKVYESIEMWKEAGLLREKKTSRTVKHVTVNLNDLIEKLRSGGLSIPFKCNSCGASIVLDRNSNAEGLKFCSYCGSAIDTDSIVSILKDALK